MRKKIKKESESDSSGNGDESESDGKEYESESDGKKYESEENVEDDLSPDEQVSGDDDDIRIID